METAVKPTDNGIWPLPVAPPAADEICLIGNQVTLPTKARMCRVAHNLVHDYLCAVDCAEIADDSAAVVSDAFANALGHPLKDLIGGDINIGLVARSYA